MASLRAVRNFWKQAKPLVKKERNWKGKLRHRRPDLWIKGFHSVSHVIYQFDRNQPSDYLSDWARRTRTPGLNHPRVRGILQNKLWFHQCMCAVGLGDAIPTLAGTIIRGRYHAETVQAGDILDAIESCGGVAVKPIASGGGHGVQLVRFRSGRFTRNGRPISTKSLRRRMSSIQAAVVEVLLDQAEYARILYPGTFNTIRVLTLRDDDGPFPAIAVQRIGSDSSPKTDNWTQGGLSAQVDLETGILGPGVAHPRLDRRLEWFHHHPDSGAAITGTAVPCWRDAHTLIKDVMARLPYIDYAGWDILMTPGGPRIIEGNHFSDVNLLQVHTPLLAEARTRRFYVDRGVVDDD